MDIKKEVYDQLVEIAKRNKPYESCAFLFKNNSLVVEAFPESRSVGHFEGIDDMVVYELTKQHGNPSALFHSHPGPAFVSGTDETYMHATMIIWKCAWLIMSGDYELKGWVMCEDDTRWYGRLVYREIEVNIVDN